MGSFDEKIRENKNEFNTKLISSIFKYQNKNRIKSFEDFKEAFISELGDKMDKGGSSAFISEDNWIKLFESSETREIIADNIGEENTREMFGELKRGQFEVHRTDGKPSQIAVTTISVPIISSKGYVNKRGRTIGNYQRAKPMRFTEKQINFLKALKPRLKQRKITTNEIITKYNNKYKEQQKTSSSISSKLYRL